MTVKWNIADNADVQHPVAIATTDASVSGGGSENVTVDRLSTSSTAGRRGVAGFCVKRALSPRSSQNVARSSACRHQCTDDSPLAALRLHHDRQRLSRSVATSPEVVVTSPTENDADSLAADTTSDSASNLCLQPDDQIQPTNATCTSHM